MKIINLDMPLVNGGDTRSSFNAILEVEGKTEAIGLDSTSHNWDKAKEAIDTFMSSPRSEADNEELARQLYNLVNVDEAVKEKIVMVKGVLDGRMAVENGHVTVDHDAIDPVLEAHILRLLKDDGTPKDGKNWRSFARFVEKLYTNTDEFVRKQLFGWLNYETMTGRGFTLTEDGNFIGYKGCAGSPEKPVSINHGTAYADGVLHRGAIPNKIGSTVEMQRSSVQNDPQVGCAAGLHVGTYDYAKDWAQGVLLTVGGDHRDVVSVPVECEAQKIRVCRYKVLDTTELPYTEATYYAEDGEDEYGDDDVCDKCGEVIRDYCDDCESCADCCIEDDYEYCEECSCGLNERGECECEDGCSRSINYNRREENDTTEEESEEEIPEDNTSHEHDGEEITFDYVKRNGEQNSYTIHITAENDYSITGTLVDSGEFRMFIKENMSNITKAEPEEAPKAEEDTRDSKAEEAPKAEEEAQGENPFEGFIKEAKRRAEEFRSNAEGAAKPRGGDNPFDLGKLFGDSEATNPLSGVMDNLKKFMEEAAAPQETPMSRFETAMKRAQEQAERQRRATQDDPWKPKAEDTPDVLGEIKNLFEDLFKAPEKDDENK